MSKSLFIQQYQTTEFTAFQYEFIWKLQNCSLFFATNTGKSFSSKEFTLDKSNQKLTLKLEIDCKFDSNTNILKGSVITAHVTASHGISVKLCIQILLVRPTDNKTFSSLCNTIIVEKQDVKTNFALPIQDNYYSPYSSYLREYVNNEDDTLTFKCIVKDIRESCNVEKPIVNPDIKMKMTTYDTFASLYKSNELFDVTFIVGVAKIHAHAVVLAAISPYFRKMFSSGMKEQRDRIVDFSNDSEITPTILRGLLDYIYGVRSVEELKDIARYLLILAVKFDMKDLQVSCESIIGSCISKTNVVSTLLLAHKHNLKMLKEKALEICKIYKNDLKASKEFEKIYEAIELVKELM